MIDTKVIFEEAHTHIAWQDQPVPGDLLRRIYDIAKLGPTCANCCPMRVVFGPMSGFDNAKVDAEFFPDGRWKSNFLCNLGYGDPAQVRPRNPRPTFEEAWRVL